MVVTEWIIDILAKFCNFRFIAMWFFPFVALAFLSICPCLIRSLFSWR